MTLFYLTRIINYMKHLLTRYPHPAETLTARDLIDFWSKDLLSREDRNRIQQTRFECRASWNMDRFGIFMLHRFAASGRIEKVDVRQENGRTLYAFSNEFCPPELVRRFWEEAKTLPVKTV